MYATIIIGIIAVLLAYCNKNNKSDKLLKLSFGIITLFLSLSYNWGPDVKSYQETFAELNSLNISVFDFETLSGLRRQGEIGWSILNIIAFPIGFWGFRTLLFSIENYILYKLVQEYVDKKWQWFAVFIYVFNAPELMVIGSPMMRQWLAMCLIVGVLLLYKHGYWKSSITLFCVTPTIHASAIISVFMIPLLFIQWNFTLTKKIIVVLLFLLLVLYGSVILAPYLVLLLAGDYDFYEIYLGNQSDSDSGLVALLKILLYLALFLSIDKVEPRDRFFIAAAFFSVLFLPLQNLGQLIVRLSYYYSIFTIVALPQFFSQTRWSFPLKYGSLLFLVSLYLYGFWVHFTGPIYYDTMFEYHTILEMHK